VDNPNNENEEAEEESSPVSSYAIKSVSVSLQ
jgi:hypothetical protein